MEWHRWQARRGTDEFILENAVARICLEAIDGRTTRNGPASVKKASCWDANADSRHPGGSPPILAPIHPQLGRLGARLQLARGLTLRGCLDTTSPSSGPRRFAGYSRLLRPSPWLVQRRF